MSTRTLDRAPVLRDYQRQAVEHVEAATAEGARRVYVELPTGTGKTVVLGEFARHVLDAGGRVLAVAHLRELVHQLADSLERSTGYPAGVVMGNEDDSRASLVVGSVQTLTPARLAHVTAARPPVLLLVDEAHHATPRNRYGRMMAGCPASVRDDDTRRTGGHR